MPNGTHGTVDFKVAAVVFLRQHDNASWRQMAADAAAAHPDNEILKRFAAEGELEPILNDPEILLGKQVEADVVATVTRCAAVLKTIWTQEIATEEINPDNIIPLAANLASTYRYAGDDVASADVLDRTLAKTGKDPILLRARALLYLHSDDDRKAVELLVECSEDPEARLFAAQVLTGKEPDRALGLLEELVPESLPKQLRPVVSEVRGEIAIVKKAAMLSAAIEQHAAPLAAQSLSVQC